MRWLVRALVFWAVCAPLFYVFGLPWVLRTLEDKSRTQNFVVCQEHLKEEHLAYADASPLSPQEADTYCHCVSDGITLTREDLLALALKKEPPRLTAAMKPIVEACNAGLQQKLGAAISNNGPSRTTYEADGTETVHFR